MCTLLLSAAIVKWKSCWGLTESHAKVNAMLVVSSVTFETLTVMSIKFRG